MRRNNHTPLFGVCFTVALLSVFSMYIFRVNAQNFSAEYTDYNECDTTRISVQTTINSEDIQSFRPIHQISTAPS